MSKPMAIRKLLIVSHENSLTGAPKVLLHLMRWIKTNTELELELIAVQGGPLSIAFEQLARSTVIFNGKGISRFIERCVPYSTSLRRIFYFLRLFCLNIRLRKEKGLVIYANTVATGEILWALPLVKATVITHCHELQHMIAQIGSDELELVKTNSSFYIAASEAVRENLIYRCQIEANRICTVYEFICTDELLPYLHNSNLEQQRAQLGLEKDALVVGASGTLDWRKGADLFPLMAKEVLAQNPNRKLYFFWVGANEHSLYYEQFMRLVADLKLENNVRLFPPTCKPYSLYTMFDVFVLMSREDPFPLVCLEAAFLKIPIVCFSGAGSMPVFVEEDCGYSVPYLDTNSMATCVSNLLSSRSDRKRMGEAGHRKVKQFYDVNHQAPLILKNIESVLA